MSDFPNILDTIRLDPADAQPGRYSARLSDDWNAPIFPSGGVTTALAIRAMEAELAQPHQRLRNFSAMFVSTVPSGPVDVDVEKLRVGKRMSQLRADLRSRGAGDPGHLVSAAFGESREGFDFTYVKAPEADEPENHEPLDSPFGGVTGFRPPFFQNVEVRRVRVFASVDTDWEGGTAEAIRWQRYRESPRLADGRIDPLSFIGLADTMPVTVGQYIGPGFPFFHAPSVDLSMRFFADTEEDWLLTRAVCHWAGDGYASAEVTMFDRQRRLVAYANQLMLIRFPDPEQLLKA